MAWVDVYNETDEFANSYNGHYDSKVNGKVYATLQYDDSSITPTSVKLRFKLICKPLANYWDQYHVLLKPGEADRSLHLLKTHYTNPNSSGATQPNGKRWTSEAAKAYWPYCAETSFIITKKYTDSKFTIPAFWLMNDGWDNTSPLTASAFYNNYDNKVNKGERGPNFRTDYDSTSVAIASSKTVATNGSAPTITITDNGNNTFTISGKQGKDGTNNPIIRTNIYFTIDGTTPSADNGHTGLFYYDGVNSPVSSEGNINILVDAAKVREKITNNNYNDLSKCTIITIHAYSYYKYTPGSQAGPAAVVSKEFKYYTNPAAPGKPILSYTKNRLTIKENWNFSWPASTFSTNGTNRGYRIRLYKISPSGIETLISPIKDHVSGNPLHDTSKTYYDRTNENTYLTIDPVMHGFNAGDKVQLGIFSYIQWGDGTWHYNGGGQSDDEVRSDIYTIQNAGIVRVKVSNTGNDMVDWKEGQVYVKINNTGDDQKDWKEAEVIKTKVSNIGNISVDWKESE
jgi:hypothetical protein